MSCRILALVLLPLLAMAMAEDAQARTLSARIDRVSTGVATLEQVKVSLHWLDGAQSGELALSAGGVIAPDLGYRFRDLAWRCPLQRIDAPQGWRCRGTIRSAGGTPLDLEVELDAAVTSAVLSRGDSRLGLDRSAASPDLTRIDLTRVPVAWAQALLAQAWPSAQLKAGRLEGRVDIHTPDQRPLQVLAQLGVAGLGLDTPDGGIAAEGLGARLDIDFRKSGQQSLVTVDGSLRGGEMLVGNGYIALPTSPVQVAVAARRQGQEGWELANVSWDDGRALQVQGSLAFDPQLSLRSADLQVGSADMAPLQPRYLSGWLGQAGLGELELRGGMDARIRVENGVLVLADASLDEVSIIDPQARFRFDGISGGVVFSAGTTVARSSLRWRGGAIGGLTFGTTALPLQSSRGELGLRQPVGIPMLGGQLRFDSLHLRPPAGARGLEFDFGLTMQALDVAQLSAALGWPEFKGSLDGVIPQARYADDRLDFDGTLTNRMFGGTVQVAGLSMERPFGSAPTLSADIGIEDLDLESLTKVFGFGQITGALDGSIMGLRLVDWNAQAFDADLHTDSTWKGRRRISQRAVQDLSSVGGGGGLGNSLQAQALKLFEDFGYRRIGISCKLAEQVCDMDGLGSAGAGFIIVEGSGLPRLTVVGYNHRVDWPTLVERLVSVTQGESKPIIE